MSYNLSELLAAAQNLDIPNRISTRTGGNSPLSFGIVNSEGNGKRLSFSKALVSALGLNDTVKIVPVPEHDIIIVGVDIPNPASLIGKLSNQGGKKICYNAFAVEYLTELFKLNFSGHTSQSFSDIRIENHDGIPMAIIEIKNKWPVTTAQTAAPKNEYE